MSAISIRLYSVSELAAVCVKVAVPFVPSPSSSADTVTIWAVLQFDGVKVSSAGVAVKSSSLPVARVTATDTSALGSDPSTIV